MKTKKYLWITAAAVFFSATVMAQTVCAQTGSGRASGGSSQEITAGNEIFQILPGEGQRCGIGYGYSVEYSFDKSPQLGMIILKIKVFDSQGGSDTSFVITGDAKMQAVSGRGTGMTNLRISTGEYLLPVNVSAPGRWEIRLIFSRNGSTVYRGRISFTV